MDEKLIEIFTKLVSIPSPSGQEKEVVEYLQLILKEQGWETWVDDTGKKNDSTTGNLYAYLEIDKALETNVFVSHIDTVQNVEEKVSVVFDGKTFRSDGNTILGADNKASVAAILKVAGCVDSKKLEKNILLFFPTREEAGVMGSSFFDFNHSKIKYIFNIDGGDVLGSCFYRAMGTLTLEIIAHGIAAHAGINYEKGKNAIEIAGHLIVNLPQGRNLEKGCTLNIGAINGGGKLNQVCDRVQMQGEVRFTNEEPKDYILEEIKEKCLEVGREFSTEIDFIIDDSSYVPPFLGDAKSDIVMHFTEICVKAGYHPEVKETYGVSDSCFLSGKGYKVITVSRGGKNAHSKNEEISLVDLIGIAKIVEGLFYS